MYTSALYFVCGLIDPGLAIHLPRSTSSFFVPAQQQPHVVSRLALHPAAS
jgi:hypothetical protein